MSQLKITEMPTASSVNLSDYVPIVQEGINKKVSVEALVGDEADRVEAENKRVQAEADRVAAEKSRVQFEEQRKRDENTRVSNENERTLKEEERISNENSRQSNEEDRVSSESARVSNENTRIENENARIEAENARIEYDLSRKNADMGGFLEQGETYSGIASNKGVKLHKVIGKTEQATTNGYQLFDASKLPTKAQGGATVTNNNDGSLTILGSGNLTENFSINYYYSKEDTLSLLKAGTLKANGLGNASPNVLFGLRNKNTGSYITGKSVSKTVNSCQIEQSDLDSLGDDIVLSISMYTAQGTQITGGTIKPMIYIDGDGTWEPFTGGKPAPNPDGAIPIKNVEITKIVSSSKNIIDGIPSETGATRCTYVFNEATRMLTIKATGYDAYVGEVADAGTEYKTRNGKLYLIPNNATKVYFKSENDILTKDYASFYDENKKSLGFYGVYTSGCAIPENAKYVSFRIGITTSTSGTWYSDRVYASFEEIGDYVEGKYNEVETSLTLAEDEVYEEGKPFVRKRKKVVLDGSSDELISFSSTNNGFNRFNVDYAIKDAYNTLGIYCNRFKIVSGIPETYTEECTISGNDATLRFIVKNDRASSLEQFKQWLSKNPVEIEYNIGSPTTEELKVPTIPSYNPHTNVWTDNTLSTDIEWELLANSDNSLDIETLEKRVAALEKQLIGG